MKKQQATVPVAISSKPSSEIARGAPWALSSETAPSGQGRRRQLADRLPEGVSLPHFLAEPCWNASGRVTAT